MSIELVHLKKQFGERVVLNGIDLKIGEGEIIFILGKSGTGKSVLLKNIVGLLKPDGGRIMIDSDEVSSFSEEQYFLVRKKCGMVFQHPALFDSLTVYENIAFGIRRHFPELDEEEIRRRVRKFLQLVNLSAGDVENKMPVQISYGMQKRVSLARTAAIEPKYLLFDEPTTGLDPVTTTAINQLIYDLSRKLKVTSIVVSHDMRCALDIADRIVVLDAGNIVAQGSPQELRKSQVPIVKDFLSEVLEQESAT